MDFERKPKGKMSIDLIDSTNNDLLSWLASTEADNTADYLIAGDFTARFLQMNSQRNGCASFRQIADIQNIKARSLNSELAAISFGFSGLSAMLGIVG
jgi:hypothetical protein